MQFIRRVVLATLLCFFSCLPASVAQAPAATPVEKSPATGQLADNQLMKAQTLLHQGDLDGAQEAADSALKLKPDSPAANLVMAQVLFHRGQIAESNEYIQKTLKFDPDNARAWLALSRVAQVVSLRKKATACIEKAHSLAPDDPEVMLAWANIRPTRAEQIAAYQQLIDAEKKRSGKEPEWVKQRIDNLKQLGDIKTDMLVSAMGHYDVPIDYILRDSTHLQGWGVKVTIGNCKPVKLMIDTGARGILIGDGLAQKCGVKKLYQGFITGIGSKPPVGIYTGLADTLQVGPVQYQNVLIDVEERTPVGDESGLIGTGLLAKFLINLNLNDYKLSLDPLPAIPGDDGKDGPKDRYVAPEMASYAKVFVVQDHLMIPTKVGADPKPALFIIDTGAGNNFIAQEYVAKLEKLNTESNIEVQGVQGKVQKVFSADDLTLQFAGFRQMNQRLITHGLGQMGDIRIAGLLGLPILRWFTLHIDYRDGLVGFEYHEPKGVDTNRLR
jgi:tetratricopeptide (TPR) repeat protein